MDIEKLIEQFRTAADKWEAEHQIILTGELRVQDALREAATALSTLRAENEQLRADLEQAKAEHDAAISDLETIMAYGGGNLDTCQYCKNGQCYARGGTKLCLPQWRGQKEG